MSLSQRLSTSIIINSPTMLLQLPPKILVQILHELDMDDFFCCQLTSKNLDYLIRESVVLQYNVALDAAQAQDNPCLSLTVAEKLRALKPSEDAWAFLCPDFTASIPETHSQLGMYDLTSGVYLLSNSTRTALHTSNCQVGKGMKSNGRF